MSSGILQHHPVLKFMMDSCFCHDGGAKLFHSTCCFFCVFQHLIEVLLVAELQQKTAQPRFPLGDSKDGTVGCFQVVARAPEHHFFKPLNLAFDSLFVG